MFISVLFLSLLLINLTTSQIPNPSRYQLTVKVNDTIEEHYAFDKDLGKMSRMWFSNTADQRFGGNQDIYIRDDNRTYFFNFVSYPSECIANRGGPSREMNYWQNLVESFGGENTTYKELLFDQDCLGTCLTWSMEYNSTAAGFIIRSQLFIKKSNLTPIKLIVKLYHIQTGEYYSTNFIQYDNWSLTIPEEEYSFPMDIKTCYYP
jgi:hypothetical protein